MDFLTNTFEQLGFLVENLSAFVEAGGWKYLVMWAIGGVLIYLAIRHDMEPTLLLPLGFGTILVNIPSSGAINQFSETGELITEGALSTLFNAGIANELFPLILFIGIGAMIDFFAYKSQADDFSAPPHSLAFSLPFVWLQCFSLRRKLLQSVLSVRRTVLPLLLLPISF